jgi:hypothetical protein
MAFAVAWVLECGAIAPLWEQPLTHERRPMEKRGNSSAIENLAASLF